MFKCKYTRPAANAWVTISKASERSDGRKALTTLCRLKGKPRGRAEALSQTACSHVDVPVFLRQPLADNGVLQRYVPEAAAADEAIAHLRSTENSRSANMTPCKTQIVTPPESIKADPRGGRVPMRECALAHGTHVIALALCCVLKYHSLSPCASSH